ncbi:hypothetical protein NDU88_007176 [Pleurodeles waltl]|uniref:Uncharacterized protein n=1 Tax=Pleurodeles waltl TaxID=8319 RepID=A0AAV7RNP0_PLEWA|nr:hypothetical protein NDU88_007176 [Pleurodeles waltl]
MELELSIIDNLKMAELRKLSKERQLTLEKGATKVDFQIALKTYEEFCQMQAATIELVSSDPEEEAVDVEEEKEDEEGDYIGTEQELQQGEEETQLIGARSPVRSSVSFTSLILEVLEDRMA